MEKKKFIYTAGVVCFVLIFIFLLVSGMKPVGKLKDKNVLSAQENVKKVTVPEKNTKVKSNIELSDVEVTAEPVDVNLTEENSGIKLEGFAEKYEYSINKGISFNMITDAIFSKVKLKGSKIRVETTVQNQKNIVIFSDGVAYSYQPRTGVAVKIDADSVTKDIKLSSSTVSQISDKFGQRSTKNGYACLMYKLNDADEVCISESYNLPVYMKISGNITNFTDITMSNISDSDFKLPGNIKFMDMKNLNEVKDIVKSTTSTQSGN